MSHVAPELSRMYESLETLTYYEILALPVDCDYVAIRDAFYRSAQRYHPDRFAGWSEESARSIVNTVYKRIAEAYNVLSDPMLRHAYDDARARGECRLSDTLRTRRLTQDERQISNTFARLYMRSAIDKLARGEVIAAWIDAKLGISLEDARPFRILLDRIERSWS